MGAIFGKKKPPSRVTEQDKAILQLKHQRDQLKQYQKKIEMKLASDRILAGKLIKDGKKERAKLLLRKKRYQEQLLQNTDSQLENLEKMTHDIEFAQIEIQVLDGLKNGNVALKKMHEALNIDEIEKIMDETREGVEKQKEIDDILSGQLTQEDEDMVEIEFNQLIGENLDVDLPEVPNVDNLEEKVELPDVPSTPEKEKKAKKERIALEAS